MDKRQPQDSYKKAEKTLFTDVDRFINEGMAGGTVSLKNDSGQIEEAIDWHEEDKPANSEK